VWVLKVFISVKQKFFKEKSLYAPTFIALKQELEDGTKFVYKKSSKRSKASRGKRKALPENEDFESERKWLLQYLGKCFRLIVGLF
jgi:hypothetical protein